MTVLPGGPGSKKFHADYIVVLIEGSHATDKSIGTVGRLGVAVQPQPERHRHGDVQDVPDLWAIPGEE